MVKASPVAYRDQANGTIMHGDTITQLRNQFIGEEKGLRYLTTFLTQREAELREKIKEQDKPKE